jgi:hypothetical protein
LAVQAGFVRANPYSRSLIERIRLSKETQWRRLLIWGATVAALSLAVGLAAPRASYVGSSAAQAAFSVLAGGTAFGACVYCLAIFALERKPRFLFAATAFSALGTGAILQAVVDFHGHAPAAHAWISMSARFVAALLLVGEAHSHARWRALSRLQSVGQLSLAVVAVLAFPIVVLPYVLDFSLLPGLGSFAYSAAACRVADTMLAFASMVLIGYALVVSHRRYMTSSDGLSGLACYFYVSMGVGLLFYLGCDDRFDRWYTMAQVAFCASWLVLVVGNGIENAFAHKEAGQRLEELETLHGVSWSLVGAGTLTELLNLFVSTLVNKLGARIAGVYLDGGQSSLELAAICGSDEAEPGTKYPLVASGPYPGFHSGHTAKAFTSREVQVANDVFVDVELVPWRIVAADDGCAASIPLADRDVCVGVLNVYFSDSAQLTTTRLRLLATIAAAATSAIEYGLSKQADQLSDDNELDLAA